MNNNSVVDATGFAMADEKEVHPDYRGGGGLVVFCEPNDRESCSF
jgi:hypothetical protein